MGDAGAIQRRAEFALEAGLEALAARERGDLRIEFGRTFDGLFVGELELGLAAPVGLTARSSCATSPAPWLAASVSSCSRRRSICCASRAASRAARNALSAAIA